MYSEVNNTSLATAQTTDFMLPTSMDDEFTSEELAEDTAGMQLNFPRVKMPSGGGLTFEVPGASSRPEIAQTLQGIILYHHPTNNYWPGGNEDENAPPSCSSMDGECGVGNPGGPCCECPHNQWGTGRMGFGKACKNGFSLYLLRSGEFLPLHFSLPPTSIKAFTDFVTTFTSRRRTVNGSLVEIGLEKTNSRNNGKDFSLATFQLIRDFAGQELKDVLTYARGMKEQIKGMNAQRASAHLERQYSEQAYPEQGFRPYEDDSDYPPFPSEEPPAYGSRYQEPPESAERLF